MKIHNNRMYSTHGDGTFSLSDFKKLGKNVVLEDGIKVFHPENIEIGNNTYIGHNSILKGYFNNTLKICDNTWIGQGCFFHSAGGIEIGKAVGIGPFVKIITSNHKETNIDIPVLFEPLDFNKVIIKSGSDIGVGSIVLPGVTIGEGAIVGAGSVVNRDIPDYSVAVGIPAKVIRSRD